MTILHALGIDVARPADAPTVDVTSHLDRRAAKADQPLDWRHSVVDLMKLLGLDSSQELRWKLALGLGYTGDIEDSAKLDVWLHQQIIRRLAKHGGSVSVELL